MIWGPVRQDCVVFALDGVVQGLKASRYEVAQNARLPHQDVVSIVDKFLAEHMAAQDRDGERCYDKRRYAGAG